MLFKRISRSDPEKVFIVVYNSYDTAALTNGQAVQWDFNTDVDGVRTPLKATLSSRNGRISTSDKETASMAPAGKAWIICARLTTSIRASSSENTPFSNFSIFGSPPS